MSTQKKNGFNNVMDKIAKVRTQGRGPFSADAPLVQVSIRSIVIKPDDKK